MTSERNFSSILVNQLTVFVKKSVRQRKEELVFLFLSNAVDDTVHSRVILPVRIFYGLEHFLVLMCPDLSGTVESVCKKVLVVFVPGRSINASGSEAIFALKETS